MLILYKISHILPDVLIVLCFLALHTTGPARGAGGEGASRPLSEAKEGETPDYLTLSLQVSNASFRVKYFCSYLT